MEFGATEEAALNIELLIRLVLTLFILQFLMLEAQALVRTPLVRVFMCWLGQQQTSQ